MSPEISVIIPAYNCQNDIGCLLTSLKRTKCASYETIVVDDASTDGTAEVCQKFDGVRLIRLPKNGGPARARNVGAASAAGEILVFVDADVLFAEDVDVIEEMSRKFRSSPHVDCISTVSHVRPVVENAIAFNNSVYHQYHMDGLFDGSSSREGRVMFFSSRLGAMRKEKFRQSGGFHESLYTVMNEDGDLWTRCYHKGFISYVDRRLYHFHRFPTDFFRFGKSYFRTALVQALLDRNWNTADDASISWAEKRRRLWAMGLCFWPVVLFWVSPAPWLVLAAVGVLGLVWLMGPMNKLVRENVPGRYLLQWYLVYVAITPGILLGYAWGIFLHFRGTSLLKGPPSTNPFFSGVK